MKYNAFIARFATVASLAGAAAVQIASGSPAQAAPLAARHAAPAAIVLAKTHAAAYRPAGTPNTPPDSYLQYKVYTVPELVKQVAANPRLVHYYAKTWHKSDAEVLHYISNNVQESYIPETAEYTVYCVRPNGLVYPTRQRMKKGTRVFALNNGTPVMKWLCGNPLTSLLPAVHENTRTIVQPSVSYLVPALPPQQVVPVEEVTPVYTPAIPVAVAPSVITRGLTAGASHSISPGVFAPLALLPLIPGGHHNGGGGGALPVAPGSHEPVPPSMVPETGTGTAVGVGFVPLAALAVIAAVRKARTA